MQFKKLLQDFVLSSVKYSLFIFGRMHLSLHFELIEKKLNFRFKIFKCKFITCVKKLNVDLIFKHKKLANFAKLAKKW